jgi:hypothetical protein
MTRFVGANGMSAAEMRPKYMFEKEEKKIFVRLHSNHGLIIIKIR